MKDLFDETKLGNLTLRNRFFRGSVWECLATRRGGMTDQLFAVYEELARGGVGTILTGYAYIIRDEQPNPNMMGIYDDSLIEEYRPLTEMVHSHDTNIIMQIVYGGSQTSMPAAKKTIWGPSAVKNLVTGVTPKEMTINDIGGLKAAFGDAAARAKAAGFDGIEIHGAHGYLLSQFLCPYYNRRADAYGGAISNRAKLIFEVYQTIRDRVGKNYPVLIKLNCQDFIEKGFTPDESLYVCKELALRGIDGIEISGGTESSPEVLANDLAAARKSPAKGREGESYFAAFAAKAASEINVPIILIGGNRHFDVMNSLLNETDIAYFSLARPLIAEPDLIRRWRKGVFDAPKCTSCNACQKTKGKKCAKKYHSS